MACCVDALVGEGRGPVLVGYAQNEDSAVFVREFLGHEPHQVLGGAQHLGGGGLQALMGIPAGAVSGWLFAIAMLVGANGTTALGRRAGVL